MRAFVVTAIGGSEVLELQDVPPPEPAPGALVVTVEAAGVNFRDIYERNGIYPTTPPFAAGVEGAGRVAAVGDGVVGFARRATGSSGAPRQGSYAEQVLVPAARRRAVPEAVPSEVAAAVFLQGLTAHYLARSTYPGGGRRDRRRPRRRRRRRPAADAGREAPRRARPGDDVGWREGARWRGAPVPTRCSATTASPTACAS